MRAVDTTAWGEALGVHPGFVSSALREKMRHVDDAGQDVKSLVNSLKDAPDDELLLALLSAQRGLGQAVTLLEEALRRAGRRSS
jgi:hypothetical protein